MRYFFDTEFDARGLVLAPISVALVSEDDRELYLINADYDWSAARPWLLENVLPHLSAASPDAVVRQEEMFGLIEQFVAGGPQLPDGRTHEFWAYNAAFDWFCLVGLSGRELAARPAGWPSGVRDVKEMCRQLGNVTLPAQCSDAHDALADARWTLDSWRYLRELAVTQRADRDRKVRGRALDEAAAALRALRATGS